MELRYYRPVPVDGRITTNFGDELNRILWPEIFPDVFDEDKGAAFFGIGSLLGYPKADDAQTRHKIIFGTGAAMAEAGRREPSDGRWKFYGVRGPLTCRSYGLEPELGLSDPAVLCARRWQRDAMPQYEFGYMPHISEAEGWSDFLAARCREEGVRYIDPRDGVEEVMAAIGSIDCMIAEAMHGAIVADAVRVPWIPVFTTRRPHRFKWTDWCRSLGMEFEPMWIGNLASLASRRGLRGGWINGPSALVFRRMLRKAKNGRRFLSTDARIEQSLNAYDRAAEAFRADLAQGCFAD